MTKRFATKFAIVAVFSICVGQLIASVVPLAVAVAQNFPNAPSPANPSDSQATNVHGTTASGTADPGVPPVITGCKYNATLPTLADGSLSDCQVGTRGSMNVQLKGTDNTNGVAASVPTDGQSAGGTALFVENFPMLLNGSTLYERWRSLNGGGDASSGIGVASTLDYVWNGTNYERTFVCAAAQPISVAASTTQQIVGLVASTQIKVCSIVLSGTAATTAQFVQGTGTNCGTGTQSLTGAVSVGTNGFAFGAGTNSILRASGSQALCLIAGAGGNVNGWLTFAQY